MARCNGKTSILHIEDDPLWIEIVAKTVEQSRTCIYLGAAGSLQGGAAMHAQLTPALVLLELRLRDSSGIKTVDALTSLAPSAKILLLTSTLNDAVLHYLRHPAIKGVVGKFSFSAERLPHIISTVTSGRPYQSPEVSESLRRFRRDPNAFYKILSNREIELLPLLGRGDSNVEIASRTGISPATVKSHRDRIVAKLGVHSTEKLMRWAVERGFVSFVDMNMSHGSQPRS